MRFKTDENLPEEAAALLNEAGFDAASVFSQQMSGAADEHVYQVCLAEDRVLIILDLDFADLRSYPVENSPGRIVLRPRRQDKQHVLEMLRRLQPILQRDPVAGQLWIVTDENVRMRP